MFTPFSTTGIGSLPHTDPAEACRLILQTFDIPFWPQLPALSFREFMVPQYADGIPFLRMDEKGERIWIEKDSSDALTRFYESFDENSSLPISVDFAQGLHTFLETVRDRRFNALKGHVTGPLTFTLGLKDAGGRLVYFDEEFREISLLILKAKTKWQIEKLRPFAERVIVFIDEPVLSALGSSTFLGVSPDEALRLLRFTSDAIRENGAVPGIHCCSKADWPMVINSGVDIISFDAYDYLESVSLYPSEFNGFLNRGGYLAWGIVPTTDALTGEDPESIRQRFGKGLETLSKSVPADLLLSRTLLTPSCGTGSRSIEETEKVFRLLIGLKELLTADYS